MCQTVLIAQNQVPSALKNAEPGKYKITNESYHKTAPFVFIDIGMEIPTKYGCSNNKEVWNPTSAGVGFIIIKDANMVKIQ
jgi:hypothetical protein